MEPEVEILRNWFGYLMDTRKGYVEAFAKLPHAELGKDRGASYPSLLDIFAHSQGAIFFWLKDVAKFEFPAQEGDGGAPLTVEVIRKDEEYIRTQTQRVMNELTDADLSRTITRVKGRGSSHDCQVPVRDVLWHLVEEELQHRGEINALLWQFDAEVPNVSWIRWAHGAGRIVHPA